MHTEFKNVFQKFLEITLRGVVYFFMLTANPNVFNFYVYLRTHPLLIRQYIASTAQDKKKGHAVVLSGFSYGSDAKPSNPDKQVRVHM
jgi:hypothetical protein